MTGSPSAVEGRPRLDMLEFLPSFNRSQALWTFPLWTFPTRRLSSADHGPQRGGFGRAAASAPRSPVRYSFVFSKKSASAPSKTDDTGLPASISPSRPSSSQIVILKREQEGLRHNADWCRMLSCEIYLEIIAGTERPPAKVLRETYYIGRGHVYGADQRLHTY